MLASQYPELLNRLWETHPEAPVFGHNNSKQFWDAPITKVGMRLALVHHYLIFIKI